MATHDTNGRTIIGLLANASGTDAGDMRPAPGECWRVTSHGMASRLDREESHLGEVRGCAWITLHPNASDDAVTALHAELREEADSIAADVHAATAAGLTDDDVRALTDRVKRERFGRFTTDARAQAADDDGDGDDVDWAALMSE